MKCVIRTKISRIGFGHTDNGGVNDVFFFSQIDLDQFINGKTDKFVVGFTP